MTNILAQVGPRLLHLVVVLLAVTLLSFLLLQLLPGDTAVALLGEGATPDAVAEVHTALGLDQPLITRYALWVANVLSGDLGRSYQSGQAVWDAILSRLPVSFQILLLTQTVALGLALPLGVYCAYRIGAPGERWVSNGAFALVALPPFALAVFLIFVFAIALHWLPATGYVPWSVDPVANLRSLVLPSLTLGLPEAAVYLRVLCTDLRTTLRQPYILTAHASGLSPSRVLVRHALPVASLSLVTLIGLHLGHVIGGAVVVETLFALPGVGRLLIDAIYARDLMVVQGVVLFVSAVYVFANFSADLTCLWLDPRIREQSQRG